MSKKTDYETHSVKQLNTCREYVIINLAFCVFDLMEDEENNIHIDRVRELLELLTGKENRNDEIIRRCIENRKAITNITDKLVMYCEHFKIFSDVLSRMLISENDEKKPAPYDTNQEAALVDQIIFSLARYREPARRNMELMQYISLLPVRMTKNRFFDRIRTAVAYYKDNSKQDFDEYIEKLRMSGLLHNNGIESEELRKYDEEWDRCVSILKNPSLSTGVESQLWDDTEKRLEELEESVDLQSMLQDIVNLIYAAAITEKYRMEPSKAYLDSMEIIRESLDGTKNEDNLISLEGKIEKAYEAFSKIEDSAARRKKLTEHEPGNQKEIERIKDIQTILLLNSGSRFADTVKQENGETADKQYIAEKTEKLIEDFERQFLKYPKKLRWAIMRNVMNDLPFPFENIDEIREYMLSSLVQCKDKTEKRAVFDKINRWMNDMDTYD